MKRNFLTIPNALSILRALLLVPFLVVMLQPIPHQRWWAFGLLALAALTDKLDGDLARLWHRESEWGRILDPLADKVGVGGVAIVLVVTGDLPLWFVLVLLSRDLLILAGGLFLKMRMGIVVPSNQAGKWTVGVISLALVAAVLQAPSWVMTTTLVASLVMTVVSTGMYVQRFLTLLPR